MDRYANLFTQKTGYEYREKYATVAMNEREGAMRTKKTDPLKNCNFNLQK